MSESLMPLSDESTITFKNWPIHSVRNKQNHYISITSTLNWNTYFPKTKEQEDRDF